MSTRIHRRYLVLLGVLIVLGVGGIAGWNAWVDPWGVYRSHTKHGWNHYKPTEGKHDRMVKAMQIRTMKPDGLLLGTSRVDWGLDEQHPALVSRCARPYNAGLAGATMYEVLRTAQHAQAVQPLKLMVVSLDVEMFTQGLVQWSFEDYRMATDADGARNWLPPWQDHTRMLLSTYALKQNKKTRKLSGKQTEWTREDLTRRGSDYFEKKDVAHYRASYPFALRQVRSNLKNLAGSQDAIDVHLGYYQQLLALAHENNIALYLYVHPYHSTALDVIKQTQGWYAFEEFKARLAEVNEAESRVRGRETFPFYDLSGYHAYAREPLPWPSAQPGAMEWYFESSHFRKKLGDRVLATVLEGAPFEPDAAAPAPE